ncbi:hypothetical protein M9H77_18010 [Catharanthus roseus]|uniref:Uncharacterized protein n=2 Tax=Catharanthus roseus TaxID=4058 RepID=A0ACC0B667_CATRO|nr:hypothetical protein M9H77_18000 [Catharanthus roseus]KAI5668157.1 hypothetical protein M9H77_18010 [Catharanthus roseus]
MMISTRKLLRMARKWQRKAAIGRKRISLFQGNNENASTSASSPSSLMAEKGQFIVYTADKKRYSFPIAYLNNYIFRELFRLAEEEFGLPSDGPITIPCEAIFMDYLISLIQRRATTEIEKALLMSMSSCRCLSLDHRDNSQLHQGMNMGSLSSSLSSDQLLG